MIVYFADKQMSVLGQASTKLDGLRITDDVKTEEIETGVATFQFDIPFDDDTRMECENLTYPGNYVLRHNEDEDEIYTIIDQDVDTSAKTVHVYAEDAGLELINEVALAYPDNIPELSSAKTLTQYVTMWIADTDFEIGVNDAASDATTIVPDWSGEATLAERLRDVADKFGYEIGYSYKISSSGFRIQKKKINIYKKRGADNGIRLRMNKEISKISISRTAGELATALLVYGAEVGGEKIKLNVGTYDSDLSIQNIYFSDRQQTHTCMVSASALAKFGRIVNGEPQHIVKVFTYDTVDKTLLAKKAAEELNRCKDIIVNYDIELVSLPGARIGDTVYIIDDKGELYLAARLLKIENSVTNNTITVTIGDYLIKPAGISSTVQSMAAEFSAAIAAARKAADDASNATTAAANATTAANSAQSAATAAQTAAANAAKTATNYISQESNGIVVANDASDTSSGSSVVIGASAVKIRKDNVTGAKFDSDGVTFYDKDGSTALASFTSTGVLVGIETENSMRINNNELKFMAHIYTTIDFSGE